MRVDPDDNLIVEVDRELRLNTTHVVDDHVIQNQDEDYREGVILRNNIATHMWADYEQNLWSYVIVLDLISCIMWLYMTSFISNLS